MSHRVQTRIYSRALLHDRPRHDLPDRAIRQPSRREQSWQRGRRNERSFRPLSRRHGPEPSGGQSFAIPPAYFALTRDHFTIVKAIHHLSVLEKGLPPSITRRSRLLADSVQPAFRNDYFAAVVEEATEKWGAEILQALTEHYSNTILEAEEKIARNAMPQDLFDTSTRLVTKWDRRQLGKRLTDAELDDALSRISTRQLIAASHEERPTGTRTIDRQLPLPKPTTRSITSRATQTTESAAFASEQPEVRPGEYLPSRSVARHPPQVLPHDGLSEDRPVDLTLDKSEAFRSGTPHPEAQPSGAGQRVSPQHPKQPEARPPQQQPETRPPQQQPEARPPQQQPEAPPQLPNLPWGLNAV